MSDDRHSRPQPSPTAAPLRGIPVTITQPYVPAYRVPLFDSLAERLTALGSELRVYASEPRGQQQQRHDRADGTWLRPLHRIGVPIRGHNLEWRPSPVPVNEGILVTELSALNGIAWRALGRRPVVLWGHGRSYTGRESNVSDRLRIAMCRRADHVMTYSEDGRRHLLDSGIGAGKVTAIGNSTDTKALTAALRKVTAQRFTNLCHQYPGPTALYVGGLDTSKRVPFLAAAAAAAHEADARFRLIVIGRGRDEGLLEPGVHAGFIERVSEARGAKLAELSTVASALWMPGRVGLAAVDAMALGLPVHTIDHDRHAPEIEWLGPHDVSMLPDEPGGFAAASLDAMAATTRGPKRPVSPRTPDLDSVVNSMLEVLTLVAGGVAYE